MKRTPDQLRRDALAIWRAGVDAVASERLVRDNVAVEDGVLRLVDTRIAAEQIGRIVVVGAGKAGAGMAAGLESALGQEWMDRTDLTGWVNVPEDCVRPLSRITLFPARPAGVNEPTEAGVEGALRILELVQNLRPSDVCICLISGGGSALMPAPAPGISLSDKLAVTRHLSAAGANIEQLNTVRKQLSRIKGGGLARACRAGHLITLIISDVLGDPLDVIASGPTVPDTTTAADALAILERFDARRSGIASRVFEHLQAKAAAETESPSLFCRVANYVIGNNAVAVDACGREAERRGYTSVLQSTRTLEGEAEAVGRHLAERARHMLSTDGPDCLISGGEPTVTLVDAARRGLGGRNQQLVLASLIELFGAGNEPGRPEGIVVLSGGTDGEDGPTDAAGAFADRALAAEARRLGLDPADYLRRNDAYHFFQPLGGLIKTGPTHTNVCDVRVVLCSRPSGGG